MNNMSRQPSMEFKDGQIDENWRIFRQHFEIFMIASGNSKKDEEVKIVILLNTIGQYGISIYN